LISLLFKLCPRSAGLDLDFSQTCVEIAIHTVALLFHHRAEA